MTDKENAAQEVVDDMITDPDKDAEHRPPPAPPQTVANEPGGNTKER